MSATTFSYAQAARGQVAAQPSPQQTSSPAPSTTGSQGKDDASTGATSVTAPSVVSTAPEVQDTEQSLASHVEAAGPQKQDTEVSSVAGTSSSTASVVEQPTKTAHEHSSKTTDVRSQSHSGDKGSRSASRTSRANDNADGKRARKGKKGRAGDKDAQSEQNQDEDAEKAKEPVQPVVLTEALPPAVNPWAKRMEAQRAAVKPKTASPDQATADNEPKQSSPQDDAGVRSTTLNGVNGSQKKPTEASRPADQLPRRSGPRGSRAGDKDEKSAASLPPAADPSSWPDPKSAAAVVEQPARKSHDKVETTEKEGLDEAGPTRKKTWEKLEIVHSVVFETQLPPLRGSKPRGGARGGREAGSMRGNHHAATAGPASAPSQSAASPASDKASTPADAVAAKNTTTRPREGSAATRSTSQPQAAHATKRPSVDGAPREQRKPSVPGFTAEQAREASLETSTVSKRASATRDIRLENGQLNSEAGHPTGRSLPHERNSFQPRGDYAKDGVHGQQYPTRDGRPERARGGSYRARGGHNGSSSHIGSANYAPNGHYQASGGFPPRQNSSAHSPPSYSGQFPASFGHPTRGRGNKWAGAGQSTGRNNPGAAGFPPKAAPVNDFAVPQYPGYMYAPVYDQSVLILKTQIEYYLSVENLCKDFYIRQNMDGQGFVPLATIAGFKRIRAMTEDIELLRLACSLSDQLEFGIGDDGIERLRSRDKWQHFILPASERLEPYRNNGPANFTPYIRADAQFAAPFPGPMAPQPYPPAATAGYPAYPDEQMFQQPAFVNGASYPPAVNGGAVNGHAHDHESRLSAGVPEYAPPQSPVTLESMTNFSDSQVDNLMLILGSDDKDESSSSDASPVAGYASEDAHLGQAGQSVNGEAANNADQPERGIVWVDGQSSAPAKAQTDRKPYVEIRRAALEQRQGAKAGETSSSMQKLYRFWSQMLLNDFNAKVYQEFRDLALEDASRDVPAKAGLKYLLEFYDRLLLNTNTRKPWPQDRAVPEIFTAHFNEAADLDRKLSGKDTAAA